MPPGHLIHRGRKVLLKHHRLLSGVHPHPPNSLAALRRSLDGGAEAVEFDIGRTRDEKFVLLHSSTLEHETSGTGPLRQVTEAQFKRLVLRDSDEPTATLAEVTGVLRGVDRRLKVQVDLKDLEQISDEVASLLLQAMAPARENPRISMVVGSMGDWNLRLLRRLDSPLAVGLDFANYLDAPVDEPVDRPLRINAYGYLDDHPLGHSRALGPRAYLEERLSAFLDLVPGASEVYLRKEFLLRALADGVNPVRFIHERKPGALVDVWTLSANEPDVERVLFTVLDAGADQITSPTSARLAEIYDRAARR